ncbi:YhcN/YlaJ family sporulation lipoprotein [Bacillus benzoevorans]|uniref:Spore cortex protein n=1 Tax=Bacillus benzoevorans TaxID=1456 RepID=A0A7X0HUP6_9BACI|nr:YhcN/YlaJ family sporulation lipoprotein [Bacillus benzoevorans]MBB6445896.1 spore cortex protein [Bacillus benzoevorans]
MRQFLKKSSIFAALVIALTGCNTNDETALQDKRTDRTMPIGYYSNENHENNGGNAIILEGSDNDGPAVEMLDHTLGKESENNRRVMRSSNSDSESNSLAPVDNRNNQRSVKPLIGRSDINYHGHLSNADRIQRQSYYEGYEGKFAERVTTAVMGVQNVKDARTIVYGKNVIIGVQLANGNLAEETKKNIQQAVQRHVDGRTVYYVTNESRFNALKAMDNDLKNGVSREQMNTDIEKLIRLLNQRGQ